MLINTVTLCEYLRNSAEQLRKGGAESSAGIYDEIADQIDEQEADFAECQEAELREARSKAIEATNLHMVRLIEAAGLAIVPDGWRRHE